LYGTPTTGKPYGSTILSNVRVRNTNAPGSVSSGVLSLSTNATRPHSYKSIDVAQAGNKSTYTVTPNTVLEFTFSSKHEGTQYRVGIDTNSAASFVTNTATGKLQIDLSHFVEFYGTDYSSTYNHDTLGDAVHHLDTN